MWLNFSKLPHEIESLVNQGIILVVNSRELDIIDFKSNKMKKHITLFAILIVIGIGAFSQNLYNTKWSVYNSSGILQGYFHFGTDTLSYSLNNITYTKVSTFQVNVNDFVIHDLTGTACPLIDTGRYTFLIRNDSLKFTLVSDECTSRSYSLTAQYYVSLTSGLPALNKSTSFSFYPNPVKDLLTIKASEIYSQYSFVILNLNGQELIKQEITEPKTTIDVSSLSGGVYFMKISGDGFVQVRKLIKE